jgi:hypothetical protein
MFIRLQEDTYSWSESKMYRAFDSKASKFYTFHISFVNAENIIRFTVLWLNASVVLWVLSVLWGYAMAKAVVLCL